MAHAIVTGGVSLRLFGGLRLERDGEPVSLPTRPTENVLALLALRGGRLLPRRAAAVEIWPDADPRAASDRLRTALLAIRRTLVPDAVLTEDDAIRLNLGVVSADIVDAGRIRRVASLVADPHEEAEQLERMLQVASADLLPKRDEPWTYEPRALWRRRVIEARLRAAELALVRGDWIAVLDHARAVLERDERQFAAWSHLLEAQSALGATTLDESFVAMRRRMRDAGVEIPGDLVALARRIASGEEKGLRVARAGERDALAGALAYVLEAEPTAALPLLASASFAKAAVRDPRAHLPILKRAIESTEGTADERVAILQLAMRLAQAVDDYGCAFDYGEWIVENVPEGGRVHRGALMLMGFMHFELRSWDEAAAAMERCERLCLRDGSEQELLSARMQSIAIRWQLGYLKEARQAYAAYMRAFDDDSTLLPGYNRATIAGNAGFVEAYLGDYAEARRHFECAEMIVQETGLDYLQGAIRVPFAFVLARTGDLRRAGEYAADGLARSLRRNYRRMHQISADFSAAILADLGHRAEALAMLERYTEFRAAATHARSVTEEAFAQSIRDVCAGVEPNAEWLAMERPAPLVAAALALLRESTNFSEATGR